MRLCRRSEKLVARSRARPTDTCPGRCSCVPSATGPASFAGPVVACLPRISPAAERAELPQQECRGQPSAGRGYKICRGQGAAHVFLSSETRLLQGIRRTSGVAPHPFWSDRFFWAPDSRSRVFANRVADPAPGGRFSIVWIKIGPRGELSAMFIPSLRPRFAGRNCRKLG
jgi:hypothetical protein